MDITNNTNPQDVAKVLTDLNGDDTPTVSRDESFDIASLLKASKEEPVVEKSELQKLKEAREQSSLGIVVDNEVLIKGNAPKELITNKSERDGLGEADEYLIEQDKLIEAAHSVTFNKKPSSPAELLSVMDALDNVAKQMPNEEQKVGTTENVEATENSEEPKKTRVIDINTGETVDQAENNEDEEEPISEEKQLIVNLLIDKTGLGGNIDLTEEEKEKLYNATEIRLKEVEEINLSSITVIEPTKSFLESVDEFQISSSKVPVSFPASRFRAYMNGLTYGEMGDISLNTENVTFDQIHKKLTVIYNKMSNPSIGNFENFTDFLNKFSYIDIDLAVYGLIVATFPEVDDIPLTCNNPSCKKSFNHKYSPRTLIRLEKSDTKFLEAMKETALADGNKTKDIYEQSPTRSLKRVKLPFSGYIVEIGIASSYDYLYNIVDNMLGDKFTENHPDDVNGILQLNSALLGLIRTVYVPTKTNSYVRYNKFEDIIQVIYTVKPEEISILSSFLQKYNDSYATYFELTDIVCPHCGVKTKRIPIDVNDLVFLKYQRLMNTEVNIDNIVVL